MREGRDVSRIDPVEEPEHGGAGRVEQDIVLKHVVEIHMPRAMPPEDGNSSPAISVRPELGREFLGCYR